MTERAGFRPPPPVPIVHGAVERPVVPAVSEEPQLSSGRVVALALSLAFAAVLAVAFVANVLNAPISPDVGNPAPPLAGEVEQPDPPVLDPGAGLPPAQISTTMTRTQLDAAMPKFLDDIFAVTGFDDPEVPADLEFPLSYSGCDATSVRGTVEIWFSASNEALALDNIFGYWQVLGYTVERSTSSVAAAGREPLLIETMSLDRVEWDDDLRLTLTSPCVLDQ